MPNNIPALDLSGEELDLLVKATSAYLHHEKFRALHSKLGLYQHARRILDSEPSPASRRLGPGGSRATDALREFHKVAVDAKKV